MPTKRERDYYAAGFQDGIAFSKGQPSDPGTLNLRRSREYMPFDPDVYNPSGFGKPKRKRKLSAWNKYVKANSKKPRFRYRNGKLNLKKMAIAFRKTPAGRK